MMHEDENGTRGRRNRSVAAVGLREGVPEEIVAHRELRVFGGVAEAALVRFLPGEVEVPPLKGHAVNLHLSAPICTVTRLDGRRWEGEQHELSVEVFPAGKAIGQTIGGAAFSEDVNVLLEEGFFRRVVEEAGADPGRVEVLDRFEGRDEGAERILLSFVPEIETDGLGGELYAQGLATALAVHLIREHSSLGERSRRSIERESNGGLSERALRKALDYVGDNLSTGGLSLAGLSAQANLSPHHFSRLFRESTGLSPHRYVIRRRVERAKELLAGADLQVVEVRLVGFAHQSHLNHHFKRLVGTSPGRFRSESRR